MAPDDPSDPASEPDDDPGFHLVGVVLEGRYEGTRRLGGGGMGTVFLARDRQLGRLVVVKVPHPDLARKKAYVERFAAEVAHLVAADHPSVVTVLGAGTVALPWQGQTVETPYLVLKYLEGGSLKDRLAAAGGRLALDAVLEWLPDVASALDDVHAQRVVHRDVKPGNILFDKRGRVYLGDFGIAKALERQDVVRTQTGAFLGSPPYMAPEVGLGRAIEPAYDQYSLAVVVYEALAGGAPFETTSAEAQIARHAYVEPPRLETRAPGVSKAVADVVHRALSKDPAARHPSCRAFADALQAAASAPTARPAAPPVTPPRTPTATPPPRPTATPVPDAGPVAPVGGERAPAGASRANASGGAGAGAASRGPSRWQGVFVALLVLAAAGAGFLAWSNRGREGAPGDAPPGGTTARERERLPETPRAPTATLSLAITSPDEGALLAANTVHVEGTISGAAGVKVTVNGTDATVTGARYEAVVVAATDGTLSLAVRASAADGSPVVATRSVTVDTTAPAVRVVSPERGEATVASDVERVEVRVSASDAHLASVTVDGQPAVAQPDGTYAATVRLAAGESKTVSVIATDAAKHASAPVAVRLRREAPKPPPPPSWRADLDAAIAAALDGKLREAAGSWDAAVSKGMDATTAPPGLRRQIEAWKAPPELEVKTPTEGATTAEATVRVTGTLVAGRATDEVYVNGTRVRTGPGAFDVPAAVTEDPFTVRVEVKDGGVVRGKAIERHGRREDAPWRAFLSGWAEPVGTALDEATKYSKRVRRTADGMEMVLVPAGTFMMGAVPGDKDAESYEKPRHSVTLTRAYYVDEHEVTMGMWRVYARATGATMPKFLSPEATDAHPMHQVSWDDVRGYVAWAKVALPTEAQWERAARGGRDDLVYPWGATDDEKKRNGGGSSDGYDGLAPVKSYPANGYGLYDMSGNVQEWCSDGKRTYAREPTTDPVGPMSAGSTHVVRGGSSNIIARALRVSERFDFAPALAGGDLGFRCARSLPAPGGG